MVGISNLFFSNILLTQKEVIQDLQTRYTNSPTQRPIIRRSLMNLLGRHHHHKHKSSSHHEGVRLFPSGDELPVCNSTDVIQMWFDENNEDIGVAPISDEEVGLSNL